MLLAPIFLSEEEAAAFVGVGVTTFREEVEARMWPAAVRRGRLGRRLTWYRPALEEAAARIATAGRGVPERPSPPARKDPPPPIGGPSPEAARDAIARIRKAAKKGPGAGS